MYKKTPSFDFIPHPLSEITVEGETFPAFYMTEEEIMEFAERFEQLKPSVKQVIMDLWDNWSGTDAPWVVAKHIIQRNQLYEQKYKASLPKKRKITSTGLPLPPKYNSL